MLHIGMYAQDDYQDTYERIRLVADRSRDFRTRADVCDNPVLTLSLQARTVGDVEGPVLGFFVFDTPPSRDTTSLVFDLVHNIWVADAKWINDDSSGMLCHNQISIGTKDIDGKAYLIEFRDYYDKQGTLDVFQFLRVCVINGETGKSIMNFIVKPDLATYSTTDGNPMVSILLLALRAKKLGVITKFEGVM